VVAFPLNKTVGRLRGFDLSSQRQVLAGDSGRHADGSSQSLPDNEKVQQAYLGEMKS
jgi:hypothetical protein